MQIPKGDSFGNRTAQLRQTAIQGPSGDGGRGMVQGVDKLYTDLGASANLDAENALFDYQKKLDAANTQAVDLFAAGEISDQDMALQHQKVVSDIPAPDFSHLSLNSEKRFLLEADKLRYSNKLKMAEGISQAQKERAKVSNQNCLANVTDQAYNGNISASGAIQALDSNDAFQKNGEFAFGLDWESQKQANYQKLQSYYILGGINDANNTGNIDQLKNIRTMLLEDNNEVNYLTPFARNKYINQANSFIDMNVGRSYSNTLTTGVDQLVERTGDFSAVKAYSWLSNNQGEEGNRLETAKYIAGRLGLLFNQQQYNDNPNYVEQLKQSYFLDSLDQYGSPIVAGLAIKFGDKQINEWLEKIGDPSKGQLLESEFINNIPDKKAKQVALQISQQTDAKESNQSDIDLILANIDHNKDLNDTQKRIAKASVKQFMKEKHFYLIT